jgi:hypothetical protein
MEWLYTSRLFMKAGGNTDIATSFTRVKPEISALRPWPFTSVLSLGAHLFDIIF